MKKLLLPIFLLSPFFSFAQVWMSFDDTAYKQWITIDTANFTHNQWQVGQPVKTVFTVPHSLPNAMVTDTAHPYLGNDTSVFMLKLPETFGSAHFAMPFLISLSFWYQLDIDTGAHAKVEMSADTGHHIWLDMTRDTSHIFAGMGGWPIPNLDTSTHGWSYFSVDFWSYLPYMTADTVLFRFTFSSSGNISHKDGWMIDEMFPFYYVEGAVPKTPETTQFKVYPNPATSRITIASLERLTSVVIYDQLGQMVRAKNSSSSKESIDISDLPRGLYILWINGREATKFKKE